MEKSVLQEIYKQYYKLPRYQNILYKLGILEKADFDTMCRWDIEFDRIIDKEKRFYKTTELPNVTAGIKEWEKDVDEEFRTERRVQYLAEKVFEIEDHIKRCCDSYTRNRDNKSLLYWVRLVRHEMWDLEGSISKLKKYKIEYDIKANKKQVRESAITELMILSAKEYPFTSLVQFNRAGLTQCPYHSEKTASFSLHKAKNYAHCFGCGKTVDTIQFVMDQYGKNFIEAVKQLSN